MKKPNTNRNRKMVVRKELVSNPVEEWVEFRCYMGNPQEGKAIAAFATEDEAAAFVKAA